MAPHLAHAAHIFCTAVHQPLSNHTVLKMADASTRHSRKRRSRVCDPGTTLTLQLVMRPGCLGISCKGPLVWLFLPIRLSQISRPAQSGPSSCPCPSSFEFSFRHVIWVECSRLTSPKSKEKIHHTSPCIRSAEALDFKVNQNIFNWCRHLSYSLYVIKTDIWISTLRPNEFMNPKLQCSFQ